MYQGHLRQRVRLPIFSCLPSYSALSANLNYAVQAVPLSLTVVYIILPQLLLLALLRNCGPLVTWSLTVYIFLL